MTGWTSLISFVIITCSLCGKVEDSLRFAETKLVFAYNTSLAHGWNLLLKSAPAPAPALAHDPAPFPAPFPFSAPAPAPAPSSAHLILCCLFKVGEESTALPGA